MNTKIVNKDSLASERSFFKKENSVECVIFGYMQGSLEVLLIKEEKSKGISKWRFPATLVKIDESTEQAAERLLREFNIGENIFLHQIEACDNVSSSAKNAIKTKSYYALINMENYRVNHSNMTYYIRWSKIKDVPDLTYDHNLIFDLSLLQLNTLFLQSPLSFDLLPEKFTMVELLNLCKEIIGTETNKYNFFKKFLQKKAFLPFVEQQIEVSQRMAITFTE